MYSATHCCQTPHSSSTCQRSRCRQQAGCAYTPHSCHDSGSHHTAPTPQRPLAPTVGGDRCKRPLGAAPPRAASRGRAPEGGPAPPPPSLRGPPRACAGSGRGRAGLRRRLRGAEGAAAAAGRLGGERGGGGRQLAARRVSAAVERGPRPGPARTGAPRRPGPGCPVVPVLPGRARGGEGRPRGGGGSGCGGAGSRGARGACPGSGGTAGLCLRPQTEHLLRWVSLRGHPSCELAFLTCPRNSHLLGFSCDHLRAVTKKNVTVIQAPSVFYALKG